MRITTVLLVLALALGGCSKMAGVMDKAAALNPFGHGERSKHARLTVGKDRRDMVIKVHPASMGYASAKEEARFEATKYCIKWTGSSSASWGLDSATGDWAAVPSGNDLIFTARCEG